MSWTCPLVCLAATPLDSTAFCKYVEIKSLEPGQSSLAQWWQCCDLITRKMINRRPSLPPHLSCRVSCPPNRQSLQKMWLFVTLVAGSGGLVGLYCCMTICFVCPSIPVISCLCSATRHQWSWPGWSCPAKYHITHHHPPQHGPASTLQNVLHTLVQYVLSRLSYLTQRVREPPEYRRSPATHLRGSGMEDGGLGWCVLQSHSEEVIGELIEIDWRSSHLTRSDQAVRGRLQSFQRSGVFRYRLQQPPKLKFLCSLALVVVVVGWVVQDKWWRQQISLQGPGPLSALCR